MNDNCPKKRKKKKQLEMKFRNGKKEEPRNNLDMENNYKRKGRKHGNKKSQDVIS